MRIHALLVMLLLVGVFRPTVAAETGRSLAAKLRTQRAQLSDSTHDMRYYRAGTAGAEYTQALNVTVYLKGDMVRCDAIVADSMFLIAPPSADSAAAGGAASPLQSRRVEKGELVGIESRIMVFDGRAWTGITPRGKNSTSEFTWHDFALINRITPLQLAEATVTGEERVRGRDCWIVTWRGGGIMDQAWVDMETFYPVRALQKTKHHEYRMENSDFRPVENAQAMPFRSELFLNNQSVLRVTTTDAQANTHVWDGLFNPENIDVPKSVRPASDRGGRSAGRR